MICQICQSLDAKPLPNIREVMEKILRNVELLELFQENERCSMQIIPPQPVFLNITRNGARVFIAESFELVTSHTDPKLIRSACMEFEILDSGSWRPVFLKDRGQGRGSYAIEYKDGDQIIHPIRLKRQARFASFWASRLSERNYGAGEVRHAFKW